MKKFLFFSFLFSFSFSTFVKAQSELSHTTTPIDSRLFETYSGDYLENLQTANPFLLKRWNFYLDNSWYLTELPAEKDSDSYATIRIEDLNNFNIFSIERKFELKRDWEKRLVCNIEGSNHVLVLLSGKEFNEKLSRHLAKAQ
ncbi:MAG: hypothetical protein GC192_01615 [Bacteroidetes bacterium]|nr:hypothetical protein [Bacteroidota bacterium]